MTRPRDFMLVVGTRPEAIKLAPVHAALRARTGARVRLVATAQHRHMLDQVLSVFGLRPDADLDLMQPAQDPSEVAARTLLGMRRLLSEDRPDVVVVQGDTTTTFAAAVAAFHERIPVAHVEAGLRTYDLEAPWPEEMNRRLVDPISRWCFAPTERAAANLRAEQIPEAAIHVTGNTSIDALHSALARIADAPPRIEGLDPTALDGRRLVLVTGHRRENLGRGLDEVCRAVAEIAATHPDVAVVYPVHLNPRVQEAALRGLSDRERVFLVPPADYLGFVALMRRAHLVISDSGGVQEEAPALGKPVLVTRETTERPEAVESGQARIVGTDAATIVREAARLLGDEDAYRAMVRPASPFGDGRAAERIAAVLTAR